MTPEATQDTAGPDDGGGLCGCCGGPVSARVGSVNYGRTIVARIRAERDRFETLWNESQAENERLSNALDHNHGCVVCAGDVGIPAGLHAGLCRGHADEAKAAVAESQALLATAREENERLSKLTHLARGYTEQKARAERAEQQVRQHHAGPGYGRTTEPCGVCMPALASLGEATPEGDNEDSGSLPDERRLRVGAALVTGRGNAHPLREAPTATQAQEGEG